MKIRSRRFRSCTGQDGSGCLPHIIDDDRRLNAERMEAAFYSGRQATPEPVQPAATESSADDKELLPEASAKSGNGSTPQVAGKTL